MPLLGEMIEVPSDVVADGLGVSTVDPGVDVRQITVVKDSLAVVIIIGTDTVGTVTLLPVGGTNGLVVAAGTDDTLLPGTLVVVEPPGALVVPDTVTGGVPFETTTVTLVPPLGVETNVDFSVGATLDSPGPTGGVVTTVGIDVSGTVAGGTCDVGLTVSTEVISNIVVVSGFTVPVD